MAALVWLGGIPILGVVIADDEKKICRLIEYLIDWEGLGVELLGVAYDGISAFKLVQETHPDILLTDIRMPGATGLELIESAKKLNPDLKCIIISGYKDFEYAQQGLRFGVTDYLLKPINQDELIHSITSIVEDAKQNRNSLDKQAEMESMIKDYSEETKRTFLRAVLNQRCGNNPEDVVKNVSDMFRQENGIGNESGRFVLVRPDTGYLDYSHDSYQMLLDKTTAILESDFSQDGISILVEPCNEGIGLYLSGDAISRTQLIKTCNHVREKVLALRDLFRGVNVTFVISGGANGIEEIIRQIYLSRFSIDNRIFLENNQIIELSHASANLYDDMQAVSRMMDQFLEEFEDTVKMENVSQFVLDAKAKLLSSNQVSGFGVHECALKMLSHFLRRLGTMDGTLKKEEITESFQVLVDHCDTVDDIFALLDQTICKIRDEVFENLKNREIRPIKFAKQYIEENKGMNISLEDLASQVGFSYTYFSSLFKKETGKTITEYIQQVRIEAAKKLLLEKDKKIPEIAALVGYNDVKFFTKQFKKTVGVSPNEFQKLFYEK